MVTAIALEI